jgi:hypothetical protein
VDGEGGNREVPPTEVLAEGEAALEEEGGSPGKDGFLRGREPKASDLPTATRS